MQQKFNSCKHHISRNRNHTQEKNSSLPQYLLINEPNYIIIDALRELSSRYGRRGNFIRLLHELLRYRNHKNRALVFPSVRLIAQKLGVCTATVRRYIQRAEEDGYLYIEDCVVLDEKGKPHYQSSRFYLTSLLQTPEDESLKEMILSRPFRKSKAAAYGHFGKVLAFIEPRTLWDKAQPTPPPRINASITLQDSSSITKITADIKNTRQTQPNDSRVFLKNDISLKEKDAKEILSAYARRMGPAGQRSREQFTTQFISGNFEKHKILADIEIMASDPLIKFTTLSPTRLFHFDERVLPMRKQLTETIKRYCRWLKSTEEVIDAVVMTKISQTWFLPRANKNEKSDEKSLELLIQEIVNLRL